MPSVTLGGASGVSTATAPQTASVAGRQGVSVWVRRGWNAEHDQLDNWTLIPYLTPVSATMAAFPGRSKAELRYDFGVIRREDNRLSNVNQYRIFSPEDLADLYVAIVVSPDWATRRAGQGVFHTAWLGVIQTDQLELMGVPATGPPNASGTQHIQCVGLESILERRFVWRAQIEHEGAAQPLDWHPVFNERQRVGFTTKANRSAGRITRARWEDLADAPVSYGFASFLYGDDAATQWSALDILEYLLYWSNDPVGTYELSVRDAAFRLDGYAPDEAGPIDPLYDYLQRYYPTIDPERRSVWSMMTELIDRRRGLSARFTWNEYDAELDPATGGQRAFLPDTRKPIGIELFSLLDEPVTVGDAVLPANPLVEQLTVDSGHGTRARVVVDTVDRYERIIVRGERLLSCFSASPGQDAAYNLATMVKGWTSAQESAYKAAGSDEERRRMIYDRVWCAFRLGFAADRDFDWELPNGPTLIPSFDDQANIDLETANPHTWVAGKHMEDVLPFIGQGEEGYESPLPIYEKPLVFVRLEGSLKPSGGVDPYYTRGDMARPPVHLRMSDRDLEIRVEASPNHLIAKNTFDAPTQPGTSKSLPVYDHQHLIVTIAVRTDSRPMVIEELPFLGERPTYRHREMVIDVPECEVWVMAHSTVTGTNANGSLKFWTGDRVVRDDTALLRQTAALAKAWYHKLRAALVYRQPGLNPVPELGALVYGIRAGQIFREVHSAVTELRYDFDERWTEIMTGGLELDLR